MSVLSRTRVLLGVMSFFTIILPAAVMAGPHPGWIPLAPLPDPIGFAGMAAGVLDGKLVAMGGSQWNRPIWRKGSRQFNDRIFVLDELDGKWRCAVAGLPEPSGHFAAAAADGAIYLAGGTDLRGCRSTVYEVRAEAGDFALRKLPDLPKPTGYAAGVFAEGRFFVMGGVSDPSSTDPSREVWSLDTADPEVGWRREADLPGPGVIVPSAGAAVKSVFLFGGMAFEAGKPVPSKAAYRLSQSGSAWERLPDIPKPRIGANSPCPLLADGSLWLVGGYAAVWTGEQREHPGFDGETYRFHVTNRTWSPGPRLPNVGAGDRDSPVDAGPVPPIGAPVVVWRSHVIVIGGEVRPTTRTPTVIAWALP
ncbi:MAG: hypothetical protein KBA71_04940 [Opitutaceae bacterium]|nr:hypothetical protein [Opitutaceae bacterium]